MNTTLDVITRYIEDADKSSRASLADNNMMEVRQWRAVHSVLRSLRDEIARGIEREARESGGPSPNESGTRPESLREPEASPAEPTSAQPTSGLAALLELQAWRSALQGLCLQFHASPQEAASEIRGRLRATKVLQAPVAPAQPLTDEQILDTATKLYPRWREDIQEKFVLTVVRAALQSTTKQD